MTNRGHTIPLLLTGFLLLAGCLAGAPGNYPDTADAEAETPSLDPKPLPDKPVPLTADNVLSYVIAFEEAYKWNQLVEQYPTASSITVSIQEDHTYLLNSTQSGFFIHLEAGLSIYADGVGSGYYTANYFLNQADVYRIQVPGQQYPGPDPMNGTRVG